MPLQHHNDVRQYVVWAVSGISVYAARTGACDRLQPKGHVPHAAKTLTSATVVQGSWRSLRCHI
jgi:hypothetical protein